MKYTNLILISAILTTIGTYVDKKIMDKGISKKDYFYYMCLTMIPFAIISLIVEIKTNNFKFEFSYFPILLLCLAAVLRYIKQRSYVGCYRNLEPYELKTYMSITLVLCFLIDIIIGVQVFNVYKLLSIVLIIGGVILIYNPKFNLKNIRKDLIIRIISDVALTYIIYNILKYWSNGVFILILNIILVFIFTPIYKPYRKESKSNNLIGLILLQQTFGFTYTYINNYLSSKSATLSNFVSPISLVFIIVGAFLLNRNKKPNLKNIFGIIIVGIGICLITTF